MTTELESGSAFYRGLALPAAILYGSIPYLIMPTLHPKIAHVLSEKERLLNGDVPTVSAQDGFRRMVSTYEMVAGILYAGPESEEIAHGLFELHRRIQGNYPDGSKYHAWNSDVWTWTWASILKAGIDILREIHDKPSDYASREEYLEEAYQGGVELGRTFGVRHLPATYAEFEVYCADMVAHTLTDNPQARWIVDMANHLPKPRQLRWVPTPLWDASTLPLRRHLRVSILLGVPDEAHHLLGLRRTSLDRLELAAHKAFWRALPRPMLERFAPTYFTLRRRFGNPLWRTEFSRETLAEARQAALEQPVRVTTA